jgi:hypothetical protein
MGHGGKIHSGRHRELVDQFEVLRDSVYVNMTNGKLQYVTRVSGAKVLWKLE